MATQQKNVLIFGGTGPTGLLVVKKTLDHGHIVTVYVRNEAKLSGDIKAHANIKVLQSISTNSFHTNKMYRS
jgi:short-subunit dehydrogenase involved in D-alanine esterification of teichoic acids